VKPCNRTTRDVHGRGPLTRALGLVTLLLYAVMATVAQASTVLIADTTLVTGSESAVFSFDAPGPGTVSVQLTNLDWPQALSSLSFMATTSSHVLSSWSDPGSTPMSFSFPVIGRGTYFADIMAVAGGPLDLGVYSFTLDFTPAASPVPLPASGALLLAGLAGIVGLGLTRWRWGTLRPSGVAVPARPAHS
jgi:hypothetical protein